MRNKIFQSLLLASVLQILSTYTIFASDNEYSNIYQIAKIIDNIESKRRNDVVINNSNRLNIKSTPIIKELSNIKKERIKKEKQEAIKKQKEKKKREEKKRKKKVNEYQTKIQNLNAPNRKEWFIQYKQLQDEYSEWIQKDTTLYDIYNVNQLELLFRIVETEVRGDCYFDEKANVASVIFNRSRIDTNNWFPDTLVGILTEYPQFESYISGAYQYVTVTETTKLACEYAYQIGDTTGGALWFDSTNGNSWASNNRTLLFTDGVGHSFYN